MRFANILHLGVKECRSLGRDRIMLTLIVYAFTLAIYTAATALPEALNNAAIAIVDEDRSPLSARITSAFYPPQFSKPELIEYHEMDARMDTGIDTFAVIIPVGFQRDVLAGRRPTIQLNADGTRVSQAFTGSGYIQTIINDEVGAFVRRYRASQELPVNLELRARFNPQLEPSWFGGIMEIISNITMLSIVLTGAALIREQERGTIEHLLVMPVTPFEIMTSKIWAMMLVVLVASAFSITVIVQWLMAVPIQGSVALFLAGAAIHLFATTSLGIFLGTLARSMPQFGLLLLLVLLPLQMLSGSVTPQESVPTALRSAMYFAPTTHFVALAQGVLYRGAGLDVVWPRLAAIAAVGCVLFIAAHARFRATLRTMH